MSTLIETCMPIMPLMITILGLEYLCYKVVVNQVANREYFYYYDRKTWMMIILIGNILGLLLFIVLEQSHPPRY